MKIYSFHIYSTRADGMWFHEDTQSWVRKHEDSTYFQTHALAERICARLAKGGPPGTSHAVLAVVGEP